MNKFLPMDVVFTVAWQIVVDNEGHLLDINTTSPNIGCDQDTASSCKNKTIVSYQDPGSENK